MSRSSSQKYMGSTVLWLLLGKDEDVKKEEAQVDLVAEVRVSTGVSYQRG